jgi:putative SbcD/Mre11-related phosphoesterase
MPISVQTPTKESTHLSLDGWHFTPEGAVVHHGERTAVIADVHLGYEWARGATGDCVVEHSLQETLTRLDAVFNRTEFLRLIIAGDLLESPKPCVNTASDLKRLRVWVADHGISLCVLEGNHDISQQRSVGMSPQNLSPLPRSCTIAGWTIGHGHYPLNGPKQISGHHHPVLRVKGISAPCFLVGPDRMILPAFSLNAAGCNVNSATAPRDWIRDSLNCLVSTGNEVLDFGPITTLRRRFRSKGY